MSSTVTDFSKVAGCHVDEVRAVSRDLVEKALRMRSVAYLANIKTQLLADTIGEADQNKQALRGITEKTLVLDETIRRLLTEVEERRRVEQALADKQRQLTTLMANLPGMAYRFIFQAPNYPCTLVSEGCLDLTGYCVGELLEGADGYHGLIHPEDREELFKHMDEGVRAGRPYTVTYRITTRDGAERWVWEQGRLADTSADGFPELEGFVVDVTGRVRAEVQLRKSEARMRLLLDSISEGIFEQTVDGRCTLVNPACLSLLGYDNPGQLLGRSIHDLIHHTRADGSPYPADECNICKVYTSGVGIHVADEVLWRRDGSSFPAECWSHPVFKDGHVVGTVVTFFDISERKAAADELSRHREDLEALVAERTMELRATNKELEAFSYSVSHDLRAPLRAIDGFSQALEEDCGDVLDEAGHDFLKRIRGAAGQMGELIDALLVLSRLTRRELSRQRVDLSALARAVVARVRDHWPGHPATVSIQDGVVAVCDPKVVAVALENLFDNAFKFTAREPHPRVAFSLTCFNGGPAYRVRDNGVGFDMRYADKLFGAFQRLHDKSDFPGTGVGLATVQRVAHSHGGEVWAHSAVGKGASFYFTLQGAKPAVPATLEQRVATG